ncbi:hypothetical protein IJZ97_01075 [bacterium]|nr:hypothetical protein [bacterium]
MKINNISTSIQFTNNQQKQKFTDKFYTHTKNSADMNDTVVVPRTIFKGYLAFMAGTTMTSLGALAKHKAIKKSLNVAGLLTCLYGTWAFVRPFVVKDAPGVSKK